MNDLTGQRFGRRRVVRYVGRDSNGKRRWEWRCACGRTGVTVEQSIKAGKSCGCYAVEKTVRRSTTHGMKRRKSAVPEYAVWTMMKRRCSDPNDPSFPRYGGRGIGYAERWETFEAFISDVGRRPSSRHSLERVDNNGNYEPTNCVWALPRQQANNTRSNTMVTYEGRSQPLSPLARRFGMKPDVVRWRIHAGWSVYDALTQPVRRGGAPFMKRNKEVYEMEDEGR